MRTRYEWDAAKQASNLEKHGLDFADAHLVYESIDKITLHTERVGESRMLDIALVHDFGQVLALAYVERAGVVRCISFRKAHKTERRLYADAEK